MKLMISLNIFDAGLFIINLSSKAKAETEVEVEQR